MQFFFDTNLTADTHSFLLPTEEAQHAIKVLRKKKGDTLYVLDGKGGKYLAEIKNIDRQNCELLVLSREYEAQNPVSIHIALALLKKRERVEWFVEKAVELGAGEITLFISANTEKQKLNTERLEKVAISALKQSGNLWLPHISVSASFETVVKKEYAGEKFIAYCETDETVLLKNSYTAGKDATVLIGPEGDFTPEEVALAVKHGFKPVNLGKLRLRAETAALTALLTLQLAQQ